MEAVSSLSRRSCPSYAHCRQKHLATEPYQTPPTGTIMSVLKKKRKKDATFDSEAVSLLLGGGRRRTHEAHIYMFKQQLATATTREQKERKYCVNKQQS